MFYLLYILFTFSLLLTRYSKILYIITISHKNTNQYQLGPKGFYWNNFTFIPKNQYFVNILCTAKPAALRCPFLMDFVKFSKSSVLLRSDGRRFQSFGHRNKILLRSLKTFHWWDMIFLLLLKLLQGSLSILKISLKMNVNMPFLILNISVGSTWGF